MVAVQQHQNHSFPGPIGVLDDSVFRGDGSGHVPSVMRSRLKRQIDRCAASARADGSFRADSVDTLLASRQVEYVITEATRDTFGRRYSTELMTIETGGIPAWSDNFIQRRITRMGLLDYVNSADMPWINVASQEISRQIRTLGARFGWSWFEIQAAQQAGVPLRGELAAAFNEAAEDTKDLIFLRGDAQLPKGLGFIPTGLLNDPNVTILAAPNGDWPTATAEEIAADLASITSFQLTAGRGVDMGDTLLVPISYWSQINSRHVLNTSILIRDGLLASTPGLKIIPVPGLETAGATGGPRMVYYANNPLVVRGILPLNTSIIADESFALRTDVYGVLRIVGVEIRRPLSMLYID